MFTVVSLRACYGRTASGNTGCTIHVAASDTAWNAAAQNSNANARYSARRRLGGVGRSSSVSHARCTAAVTRAAWSWAGRGGRSPNCSGFPAPFLSSGHAKWKLTRERRFERSDGYRQRSSFVAGMRMRAGSNASRSLASSPAILIVK